MSHLSYHQEGDSQPLNYLVSNTAEAITSKRAHFDTDSYDMLIDNCCSHSITNSLEDYITPPKPSKVIIKGFNGHKTSTMVGTVKWTILDDNHQEHTIILPETYYSAHKHKLDYFHHSIGHKPETKED